MGWLRKLAALRLKKCRKLLDLGAGPGYMSKEVGCENKICVLLDVLPWRSRSNNRRECRVLGVYESLPLRAGSFDCAVAAFSLRDSFSLEEALKEIREVLAEKGRLVVLDLGKPSGIAAALVSFYWRILSKLLVALTGPLAPLYAELEKTYRMLPVNAELSKIYEAYFFGRVKIEELLMGAVIILTAIKD